MAKETKGDIMIFTEENKKRWLPDKPGTHEEYLDNLRLTNKKGEDFGTIMSYDPALAEKYEVRISDAQGS